MYAIRRLFRCLNTNPVAVTESAYLRDHVRSLLHWRYAPLHVLFAAAAFAAGLPLVMSITIDYTRLLAAMIVLVFAVQLVVSLRTALVAAHTLSREFPVERWQTLATGAYTARQIVLGKWWAAMRATWRPHLLLALLRVGLALGLAQHAYDAVRLGWGDLPVSVLAYYPTYWDFDRPGVPPALITSLFASLIVVLDSLAGVGLAALIGLGGALFARSRRVNVPWLVVTLYSMMLSLVLTAAKVFDDRLHIARQWVSRGWSFYDLYYLELHGMVAGLVSLGDGGVSIAANLLQPHNSMISNVFCGLLPLTIGVGLTGAVFVLGLWVTTRSAVRGGLGATRPVDWLAIWRRWWANPLLRPTSIPNYRAMLVVRWSNVFTLMLFSIAFGVLMLLHQRVVGCGDGATLRQMAMVLGMFQTAVMARTLLLATYVMHRLVNNNAWDTLVLTGLDARKIVRGTWWAIFTGAWPYHMLTAIVRLPFIYQLALYMRTTQVEFSLTALERTFNHISSNFVGSYQCYDYRGSGYFSFYILFQPNILSSTFLKWVWIVIAFALLDAALSVTLGILGALLMRRHVSLQLVTGLLLRILPVAITIIVWSPLTSAALAPREVSSLSFSEAFEAHQILRILDTLQVALATPLDGGITAVNLGAQYAPAGFLLRQWIGYTLGFGLYALLTVLALHAAARLAIRRGALPPPRDPI